MSSGNKILAGHGFRSDPQAADELREYFSLEVISLKNRHPYFYHLGTSLAVLLDGTVAFYLGAINADSQQRLRAAIPNVIEAALEEAKSFGLNAVSDDHTVITRCKNIATLALRRSESTSPNFANPAASNV
ncbi:MAG TPA: hypothetical protein VF809_00745 [Candidatus Saccharimonadales bacterium]